ncbi:MAG: hypothetical protein CND89_00285 [Marine Group II euryarchaeote MED-G38]|nr:hypothetical protein [Euryarchaeota archaeon]OUV25575.1 MAG: hypothetical protein CBC57_04515 [Euryarchaeota archaeon TMED97]PDH23801.1 MAG: hypothetical protein CND89_00285 [Marine Group II euryarchaeote MED-G38]|tara:strand:- start:55230 stop:55859 length:630 start_codon:yes stop_codon:yes gene_type:complete
MMTKSKGYTRHGLLVLSVVILTTLISSSVSAQDRYSEESGLSGICFLAPIFLLTIFGLVWAILYPTMLLWAFLFSGKKLDNMILNTAERESQIFSQLGKDPLSTVDGGYRKDVNKAGIVWSGAVYGPSHWHLLIAWINNLFGGSVDIFQKVISAGRAESMQRLRETAIREGWDEVINVRIDTAVMSPGTNKKGIRAVEVFAYGTGIKYG